MEKIVFEVDEETAKKWQEIAPELRAKLEKRFQQQIDDLARKNKLARFEKLLNEIRDEAQANGLTEEILQEILKEDE